MSEANGEQFVVEAPEGWWRVEPGDDVGLAAVSPGIGVTSGETIAVFARSVARAGRRVGASATVAVVRGGAERADGDGTALGSALVELLATDEAVVGVGRVRAVDLPLGRTVCIARRRVHVEEGAALVLAEVVYVTPIAGRAAAVLTTCTTTAEGMSGATHALFDELAASVVPAPIGVQGPVPAMAVCA